MTPMKIRYYADGNIIQTEAPLYDDVKEEIAPGIWVDCARKAPGQEKPIPRKPTAEEAAAAKAPMVEPMPAPAGAPAPPKRVSRGVVDG
jgi:hypothetical protein